MSNVDEKVVSWIEKETGLDLLWGDATFEEESASMVVRGYVADNVFVAAYVCVMDGDDQLKNVNSQEILDFIQASDTK